MGDYDPTMSPSSEELALGAKAYSRMRLHEMNAASYTRRDRWLIAGFIVFMIFWIFAENIHFSHRDWENYISFVPLVLVWGWMLNRERKDSYENQKLILRLLEEKYGDALPWVMEQKQLAQARELEMAIAQQQQPTGHA